MIVVIQEGVLIEVKFVDVEVEDVLVSSQVHVHLQVKLGNHQLQGVLRAIFQLHSLSNLFFLATNEGGNFIPVIVLAVH